MAGVGNPGPYRRGALRRPALPALRRLRRLARPGPRLGAFDPAPTLGQFHDALRHLHADGRVYLHPWTGPLYALPDPPAALQNVWALDPVEGARWWRFPLSVKGYFDNGGQESQAKLLDVSSNGFCATHSHPDLQPGREVRFIHLFFVGIARVVWTKGAGGRTQSGFQILRR